MLITSKYREENTILTVDILLNNKIIKHYDKKIKMIYGYEKRKNKDGITYWYHPQTHISLYKNPNIEK